MKIVSKALAARMKTVMNGLISYDQTAYAKGRYIGESVHLIDNLLKYAEDENINRILFADNIEKTFDHPVDHNFMFATFKKFGFGNDFVRWIKTIFKDSQSTSTGYFNLERGARQGYPLSPYFYLSFRDSIYSDQ